MSRHHFGARHVVSALTGLDFGVRVRLQPVGLQRTLFSGAESRYVQVLSEELAEVVSGLRVYSYALRDGLERITTALQVNVQCGEWRFARRAALDLAGLLNTARRRRQANADRCSRGERVALRIAELCGKEVR